MAGELDVIALRDAMTAARKRFFSNGRDFVAPSGLSHSTIAKLENTETYPDYDPGILIVARYLKPLGWTVAAFLEDLEIRAGSQNSFLNEITTSSKDPVLSTSTELTSSVTGPSESRGDHENAAVSPSPDIVAFGRLLARAGLILQSTGATGTVAAKPPTLRRDADRKSGSGKTRR